MSDVDRIKERLGIVDVIGSYIPVQKAGAGYKAKCPFHNEKTPSFNISADRNLYYCFGCGARGDIFTFVEEFEGLDFSGALKFLADKAGVELTGAPKKDKREQDLLYGALERATKYFEEKLRENDDALSYVKGRGINDDTIKNFRIGYAPVGWSNVYDALKEEGFSQEIIERAGLIKKSDRHTGDGLSMYDRFRNRIMFPIADPVGRIIAFSGRALDAGDTGAKYINSPETVLFNKSDTLFGYDKAKQHIKKTDRCILVEGQIDLIMAHQAGFQESVAASGTSVTGSHISRIRRLSDNLIIAFDRDRAGLLSMKKTAMVALGLGMDVRVVLLPEGKDPADMIVGDRNAWKSSVVEAPHVVDLFLREITKKNFKQREYWQHIKKHVLSLVKEIPDSIDRAHFIDEIHKITGIPERSIKEEMSRMALLPRSNDKAVTDNNRSPVSVKGSSRMDAIMKTLVAILYWQSESKKSIIDSDELRARIEGLTEGAGTNEIDTSDLQPIVFEIERVYSDREKLLGFIEELMLSLEEEILIRTQKRISREIREAERARDKGEQTRLMEAHVENANKLEEIKQKIKSRID